MAMLTPAPINFQQKIRSELTEGLQLSYYDIIPSVMHMRTTLNAVGGPARPNFLGTQGTDIFRIPGDYNFLIGEVHAHLAMNAIASEDTVGAAGPNALVGVRNRAIVKALNAKVSLVNADRNDLRFTELDIQNSSANGAVVSPLCLASLMPMAGGSPVHLIQKGYIMPLVVPGNERLRLVVTLRDGNAAVGETEYGLMLIGALVRSRGDNAPTSARQA
jgi:hypothetical protein